MSHGRPTLLGGYDESTGARDPSIHVSRLHVEDGDQWWQRPYCLALTSDTTLDGLVLEGKTNCSGWNFHDGCYTSVGVGVFVMPGSANVTI